jgi:metallo-beta-lactamase class B
VVAAFRSSIAKIADSPCEILVTPRPPATPFATQLGLGRPLLDTDACKTYAAATTKLLDDRLATESAPSPPKP